MQTAPPNVWDRFTEDTRVAIFRAMEAAKANRLLEVGPEAMLQGVLTFDCTGRRALQGLAIDLDKLNQCLQHDGPGAGDFDDMALSDLGKIAIDNAHMEMVRAGLKAINTLTLVLGCIQSGEPRVNQAVDLFQISRDELRKRLSEPTEPSDSPPSLLVRFRKAIVDVLKSPT